MTDVYWQEENRRRVVVAYWSISNVNECTPFWGSISRDVRIFYALRVTHELLIIIAALCWLVHFPLLPRYIALIHVLQVLIKG